MFSLNLPAFEAKIITRDGKRSIFDVIRRRYVALTPEEWVRQHFVHFLMTHKGYPQALMANEVQVQLNGTKKRCDTVLFNEIACPFVDRVNDIVVVSDFVLAARHCHEKVVGFDYLDFVDCNAAVNRQRSDCFQISSSEGFPEFDV